MKLQSAKFEVEHPDGKLYSIDDPIEFVVSLMQSGHLTEDGTPKPDAVLQLRDKTKECFGFPSLTCPQMMEVMAGIMAYMNDLQKKTFPTPTSPQRTATSPAMPKRA